MKLAYTPRASTKKCDRNALRRQGAIPAILYVKGQNGIPITIDKTEFTSHLRHIKKGHLATTKFTLSHEGTEFPALVKGIQYNPVSYDIIHLDLEKLDPAQKINVKVPINLIGMADCIGVKAGGFCRLIISHLTISCLPKDMPISFDVDITKMNLRESKRLKDLDLPAGVTPLKDLDHVFVVVAKR